MKNKFIIKDIYVKNQKIFYNYEIKGNENFKKLFWLGELFSVEYNENIDNIPKSILAIPLLSNILPIIWVNNAIIYLDEIDKTFYDSIKNIKKVYKKMYSKKMYSKKIQFKGKIKYHKKVNNYYNTPPEKTITFFSGGVDSYYTLIKRINEKPDLITIWGADIDYENEKGWSIVKDYIENIGNKYNLKNVEIHSALRRFIDNSELEKQYHDILQDDWWHAMQHGIGLIGNAAPYAYKYNVKTIYMPATCNKKSSFLCASNPEIDNNFKFASTSVLHEGYEANRQQKTEKICNYIKETDDNINLRVCYRSLNGDNCCKCEKCYRTIMAIISQKINPNDLGFHVDKKVLKQIEKSVTKTDMLKNIAAKTMWKDIIKAFKKEEKFWSKYNEIKWILSLKV